MTRCRREFRDWKLEIEKRKKRINAEIAETQRRIAGLNDLRNCLRFCRGPSAPWPAHQTPVRKKIPATPVGMTD